MNTLKWIWTHLLVCTLSVGLTYELAKSWYAEHEAHALAEQSLKASQQNIAVLQSNIAAVTAQASSDRARLQRALASVKTPKQAAAAIPSIPLLTNLPLNMRQAPDSPVQVSVDSVALYTELNTCAQQTVELTACTQKAADLTQIEAQQTAQIAVLKKKSPLLSRVRHVAEAVGIGIGIGFILGVAR